MPKRCRKGCETLVVESVAAAVVTVVWNPSFLAIIFSGWMSQDEDSAKSGNNPTDHSESCWRRHFYSGFKKSGSSPWFSIDTPCEVPTATKQP